MLRLRHPALYVSVGIASIMACDDHQGPFGPLALINRSVGPNHLTKFTRSGASAAALPASPSKASVSKAAAIRENVSATSSGPASAVDHVLHPAAISEPLAAVSTRRTGPKERVIPLLPRLVQEALKGRGWTDGIGEPLARLLSPPRLHGASS